MWQYIRFCMAKKTIRLPEESISNAFEKKQQKNLKYYLMPAGPTKIQDSLK